MTLSEYKIIDKILGIPFETSKGKKLMMGGYKTNHNGKEVEHALVYKGTIENPKKSINLRINSACYTSDIFDCQRCDCSWQLKQATDYIIKHGGLIIYHFHHEGRAFGFTNKLRSLQIIEESGKSSWEACLELHDKTDHRSYLSSIKILKDLGINDVTLLSNSPQKEAILNEYNIKVHAMHNLVASDTKLRNYLSYKKEELGHYIKFPES
jgi:3,4-dihydroxy 2-butanone 4-phosphate synthase/GTP cyclohydrolase II